MGCYHSFGFAPFNNRKVFIALALAPVLGLLLKGNGVGCTGDVGRNAAGKGIGKAASTVGTLAWDGICAAGKGIGKAASAVGKGIGSFFSWVARGFKSK